MPALQTLALVDRESTPVTHTFTPFEIDANGVGVVTEGGDVQVSASRYTVQMRRVAGRYKARLKMAVPVVQTETINGVSNPKVVYQSYVDATFTFDSKSTEQHRKNVVGMFASSLDASKVLVNDTLIKLQGIYR